jgi:hypothetical protein
MFMLPSVSGGAPPPRPLSLSSVGRYHGLASPVLTQRLPRRVLHRSPRGPLPRRARRARRRVLHADRIEPRTPASLVVPRELEVVALVRHADDDGADAGPGVEPAMKRVEHRRALTFKAEEGERGDHQAGATVRRLARAFW